jgi:trk system potassium uptake protein TrkA
MNFIVIGLGNFGASLAKRLTALGHDVIGVDKELEKVEFFKDVITNTISMDITDIHALKTLPLKDCDMVIVCIGDDFGSSVKTTALLKKLGVTNLYGRESSLIHKTVLNAIGVSNTINPEYDTAFVFAEKLIMTGVISIFSITDELKIAEINIPEDWIGKKLDEVDKTNVQGIDIVSVKFPDLKVTQQPSEKWIAISVNKCKPEMILESGMRLVIQGSKKEIMNFMRM